MLERVRIKSLAIATLLLIAAGALHCAFAQQPGATGSLSGRLTDPHSTPLANITVILCNEATGAQIRLTTSRGGRYHFSGLSEGEYTLTASGPRGSGHVDRIFVPAGHEAQVQTAIQFEAPQLEVADQRERMESDILTSTARMITMKHPLPETFDRVFFMGDVSFPTEAVVLLNLSGIQTMRLSDLPFSASDSSPGHPESPTKMSGPANPEIPIAGAISPPDITVAADEAGLALTLNIAAQALARVGTILEIAPMHASLVTAATGLKRQIAVSQGASIPQSSQSIGSTQLQALSLPGRDWQSFFLDTYEPPAGNSGGEEQRSPTTTAPAPQMTVEGAQMRLAFGSPNGTRTRALMSPGLGDSAIGELQFTRIEPETISSPARTNIETQRGGDHLHGQAFIFNRQNLWGAQNPFTQWTQETALALPSAIPVFTPQPYTPADRESLGGAGFGGALPRRHLFWFAALDGFQRNNPAVASVKHPDNFFAQPSNDQMQLLSAQLGLSSADPVSAGVVAYSNILQTLAGLLGPGTRSSSQLVGFGRLDWNAAEHHRFTLEATGGRLNSPGGGFSSSSETYGTHSFGLVKANEQWMLGKWDAFLTPNLLAVTQGSYGHEVYSASAETPSPFEQSLNISLWGQLPQIVVDSRYGFTIGNPARFGRGSYPDEHLYFVQEQLDWVRGELMLKAGVEISHNTDATSQLRNQTGTYYYSSAEDFASDALAFASFGLSGQLNPMDQHNCDQTGKAWRDTSGVLHGLGYLPCYSYYSQTMGPSDWWLSTNDWAGYLHSQWAPTRGTAFTLAVRWELEQLPPAIASLRNPDLPLTEHLPGLGAQWGPRAGFAWGSSESHWPVVRLGYGMYFSPTRNAVAENALTQTGSLKGDLNFFMRPTDNLNAGGAPPFPYVLAGEPANVVKPGAVEFAPSFRNGEIHQAEASIEQTVPGRIHVEASAVASLGRRLPVTFDANIDPATYGKTITYAVIDGSGGGPIKSAQITVPFFASWPSLTSPTGFSGRINPNYQQVSEIFSRANSTYEAAILRISRNARAFTLRGRYIYAHAMDWNPDETSQVSGPSVLDPLDFRQEYGTSSLDVRHSAMAAVILEPKWKLKNLAGYAVNRWSLSSTASFRSGLPYTMRTAGSLAKEFDSGGTAIVALSTGMNGYGGDNRVYSVGRNTYRYPLTWKADMRLGRRFDLGRMRQLELMAESFNLFNHQNVTELETTGYSIESGTVNGGLPRLDFLTGLKTGQTEFGKPLNINATDFYRPRQIQFGARFRF